MSASKEFAREADDACGDVSWINQMTAAAQQNVGESLLPEKSWKLISAADLLALPSKQEVLTSSLRVRLQKMATMFFACVGVAGTLTFLLLIARAPSIARHETSEHGAAPAQDRIPPAHPDLGLTVQDEGDRLLITWNREAAPVRNATQGVFTINDGLNQRKIELDAEQVANGEILYRQRSEDVSFRLEVANQDGTLGSGAVQVLGAMNGERISSKPAGRPAIEVGRMPATEAAAVVEREKGPVKQAETVEPAVNTFVASVLRPPAVDTKPEKFEAPPSVDGPAISGTESVTGLLNIPTPVPMPAAKREPSTPATPRETSLYSFPQPLREVSPRLPSTGLLGTQLVVANLVVHIDEKGRVTTVRFSTPPTDLMPLTMTAIKQAAKQWQFRPALLHGKAVGSDFQIAFRIHPDR